MHRQFVKNTVLDFISHTSYVFRVYNVWQHPNLERENVIVVLKLTPFESSQLLAWHAKFVHDRKISAVVTRVGLSELHQMSLRQSSLAAMLGDHRATF